tara:strand:- start:401 stop:820 length:420 start_codon:yes stop_codon:yes gene_type:complete
MSNTLWRFVPAEADAFHAEQDELHEANEWEYRKDLLDVDTLASECREVMLGNWGESAYWEWKRATKRMNRVALVSQLYAEQGYHLSRDVARKVYNSLTKVEQKLACEAVQREIEEWDEDEREAELEVLRDIATLEICGE